jgi:hypothetical protein
MNSSAESPSPPRPVTRLGHVLWFTCTEDPAGVAGKYQKKGKEPEFDLHT